MPKKIYDVVTIGGAVRDITFYTDGGTLQKTREADRVVQNLCFLHGGKIPIKDAFFTLGGGACNTAVCFSKLGLKVGIISAVGDDSNAKDIFNDLKRHSVDSALLQKQKGVYTGFSLIVASTNTHDHIVFGYRGANANMRITPKLLNSFSTKWLYVTGLTGDTKQWYNNLQQIFSFVRRKKIKIAWNPGYTQLVSGKKGLGLFMKHTDVFAVNTDEAYELVLSASRKHVSVLDSTSGDARVRYLAEVLQSWGPRIVVITAGKLGAYAYDGEKHYFKKATPKKAKDTTGAGDCFNSSFVAGQLHYPSLPDSIDVSLELGIMNTDSLVRYIGAQEGLLTWKELISKLPQSTRSLL